MSITRIVLQWAPNKVTSLLLVSLLMVLVAPTVNAEDWYRFRGPNFSGISSETQWTHDWPAGGPAVVWKADVGVGLSSVSISDGRLYTMGNEDDIDTVHCLDHDTGRSVWSHSYASPVEANEFDGGPTSTPTIDGDVVYTLSRSGDLFALNKITGDVLWSLQVADEAKVRVPSWGFSGSPLVQDNLLILNVGDAGVAVDKKRGTLVWTSEDKDAGYSSPVPISLGNRPCVVFGSSRSYVCVDPVTGEELWRQRWLTTFGCNAADAIEVGDHLFLSSGYNRGSALLRFIGGAPEVVWKHKDFQNQLASSVLIGGHLYGASGDVAAGAKLVCIEAMTGKVKWADDSFRIGGVSAAGDRLILLSDSGELLIARASAERFELLAKHQAIDGKCWTAPVLCGGRIVCRTTQGRTASIDVRP